MTKRKTGLTLAAAAMAVSVLPGSAAAITGPGVTDVHPLIVGGQPASPYPFAVSLQRDPHNTPDTHYCTGTLIAETWVITAAHCAELEQAPAPEDVHVRVGSVDNMTGGGEARVTKIVHPGFSEEPPARDIALVKLDRPVYQQPATLASNEPEPGSPVTALGWGKTTRDASAPMPRRLRELSTTVRPKQDCASAGLREMCVDSPHGQGVCFGDSGGPALNENGQVAGVLSRWIGPQECGVVPATYTSVSHYRAWVVYRIILGLAPDAPVTAQDIQRAQAS